MQTNSTEGVNRQARRSSSPDDQALNALFAGQMQFSIDMFKAVYNASSRSVPAKGAGDNIFFSPMSVYSALLLAYFGSNNRTEDQLSQALGFKDMDKVCFEFILSDIEWHVLVALVVYAFYRSKLIKKIKREIVMEKTYGKAARLKAFRDRFAFPSSLQTLQCVDPHWHNP